MALIGDPSVPWDAFQARDWLNKITTLIVKHGRGPSEVVAWAYKDISPSVYEAHTIYVHISMLIQTPFPWKIDFSGTPDQRTPAGDVDLTGTLVKMPSWKGGRIWRLTGEIVHRDETDADYFVAKWPD